MALSGEKKVPSTLGDAPLGLYVHIPWCVQKCPYCDFNSHASGGNLPVLDYVGALLWDLDSQIDSIAGRTVDTIFIGGGTPSLFAAEAIATLLEGINGIVPVAHDAEVTMEANPGTVECGALSGYRQAGINRLSLGVQSFDQVKLKVLGRIHGPEEAHAALVQAKSTGFDQINVDLMFGLPGQTDAEAVRDLELTLAYMPTHISYYQLTLEPNTQFHKHPPSLPSEEEMESIQSAGERLLEAAGYGRYEVSAYSLPGHQCRHNLNYWRFGDYVGIGAGAHGKVRDVATGVHMRRWNVRGPQDYMTAVPMGKQVSGVSEVTRSDLIIEFMMNALRLCGGFEASLFTATTGLPLGALHPLLQGPIDSGLLTFEANRIEPTPLGMRFLDDLVLQFQMG